MSREASLVRCKACGQDHDPYWIYEIDLDHDKQVKICHTCYSGEFAGKAYLRCADMDCDYQTAHKHIGDVLPDYEPGCTEFAPAWSFKCPQCESGDFHYAELEIVP